MAYCYYSKAESLLREIRIYGRSSDSVMLRQIVSDAIDDARGHYILDVLRSLAKIRKIIDQKVAKKCTIVQGVASQQTVVSAKVELTGLYVTTVCGKMNKAKKTRKTKTIVAKQRAKPPL